jgi:hypothetical protein
VRNPAFVALLDEIRALHDSKNHDYTHDGDPLSNLRECEAMGVPALTGVLVRLTDKWSRIKQLVSGKTPKHESLRDSLVDNAVYSLLAVLLLDERLLPSAPNAEPPAASERVVPTRRFGPEYAAMGSTTTQRSVRTVVTGMANESD